MVDIITLLTVGMNPTKLSFSRLRHHTP